MTTGLEPAGHLPATIRVELVKSRRLARRQPWRWVARAANGRQLANSGEWYTNRADAVAAIYLLFGYGTNIVLRQDQIGDVTLRTARQ